MLIDAERGAVNSRAGRQEARIEADQRLLAPTSLEAGVEIPPIAGVVGVRGPDVGIFDDAEAAALDH
jgi:hypothetical protein